MASPSGLASGVCPHSVFLFFTPHFHPLARALVVYKNMYSNTFAFFVLPLFCYVQFLLEKLICINFYYLNFIPSFHYARLALRYGTGKTQELGCRGVVGGGGCFPYEITCLSRDVERARTSWKMIVWKKGCVSSCLLSVHSSLPPSTPPPFFHVWPICFTFFSIHSIRHIKCSTFWLLHCFVLLSC